MARRADVIVAGVGGCGASVLYHLARQGVRAVGIDRFEPGHDRGSSHGDTRVIRMAYFEHPDYVPLLRQSYDLWEEIEAESGEDLLEICGLFGAGPPGGEILRGARLSAERHGAPLESIDRAAFAERFPCFTVPEDYEAIWEPMGGYLHVERAVRAYARCALDRGATVETGTTIRSWHAEPGGVRVETDRGRFEADRLVLCPGAWAGSLLPELVGLAELRVLRKVLLWYPNTSESPPPDSVFFFELPYGIFYGFPCLDGRSVKLAEHSGGLAIEDPLALDRGLHAADTEAPDRFVREVMPGLEAAPMRHEVCMYTMTRDAHFLVDRHPELANVLFAAGFSGHGFKFMSALGAILAELATEGRTTAPIDFLGLERLAAPTVL